MSTAQRVKFGVRRTLAHVLYRLGLLHLWKHVTLRHRAVVLTYHRVLDDEDLTRTWSHPAIVVRRRTFERHMRVLRRHFTMLSLADFVSHLEEGRAFRRPSCLVTFDDGWVDTYEQAWPVLRAERIPAVVFLPTRFISGHETFWQERLGALLNAVWTRARTDREFAGRARPVLGRHGLDGVLDLPPDSARPAIRQLMQSRKMDESVSSRAPIAALCALLGDAAPGLGSDTFITWEQARLMAKDGVDFGGHSATHRILTTLEPSEVEQEVQASMRDLRDQLGEVPASFSYPNGNYHAEAEAAVRRAGYRVAFSTRKGSVSPGDDRLAIRRINIHEDVTCDAPLFLARITGVL